MRVTGSGRERRSTELSVTYSATPARHCMTSEGHGHHASILTGHASRMIPGPYLLCLPIKSDTGNSRLSLYGSASSCCVCFALSWLRHLGSQLFLQLCSRGKFDTDKGAGGFPGSCSCFREVPCGSAASAHSASGECDSQRCA